MGARRSWGRKKKLSCRPTDNRTHEIGRQIYNSKCYFCHGYSGNAATVATRMLVPVPRDFTSAPDLRTLDVETAVRAGRPGTAMTSFASILTDAQISAVAQFVVSEFVACGHLNTSYHTAENGWPRHRERYGAAYPFVLGNRDAGTAAGWLLYREACIVCHDLAALQMHRPSAAPSVVAGYEAGAHHDEEEYEEYGKSDAVDAPVLSDLSAIEARGEFLYQRVCADCHGADGRSGNWVGRFLLPRPIDFTSNEARRLTDEKIMKAILEGVPETSMPAFRSVLTTEDAVAVVAYLRRAFVMAQAPAAPMDE